MIWFHKKYPCTLLRESATLLTVYTNEMKKEAKKQCVEKEEDSNKEGRTCCFGKQSKESKSQHRAWKWMLLLWKK